MGTDLPAGGDIIAARARSTAHPKPGIDKDLRVLAKFVQVYCQGVHEDRDKARDPELPGMSARPGHALPELCAECADLLRYATARRLRCPMDPKPMCKKCPTHCYAPKYRAQIRKVMAYSGRKLVLTGRIHYLYHLLA